jgi:hypothetical protein
MHDLKLRPIPGLPRQPMPAPNGELVYQALKTSFIDFPRLLITLRHQGFTGYLRLLTDDATALTCFQEGMALECVFDAGPDAAMYGNGTLQRFGFEVARGKGVLDLVELASELVQALVRLIEAAPIYTQLCARSINPQGLLRFLADHKLTGGLIVRAGSDTGVIMMSDGQLVGAYTGRSRRASDNTDGVLALCEDPEAMIEVKAISNVPIEPLDVSDVVGDTGPPQQPKVS